MSGTATGIVEYQETGGSSGSASGSDKESLSSKKSGKQSSSKYSSSSSEKHHHSRHHDADDKRHHSSSKKSTNDDLASALMMSMTTSGNHESYYEDEDDGHQCSIETEDSENDSGSFTGSDITEGSDMEFDEHDGHQFHADNVEVDKLKVHCSEIVLQLLRESEFGGNVNPLLSACASGNSELLDRIISDGLFCAKPFFIQLLYVAAAYPIEQVATDMYVIIKDAVAGCNGAENGSDYSPCLKCRGFGSK